MLLETAGQSLHHSCRTELTRQGISLPLNRQSYSCRLLELILQAFTFCFHFHSTGQVSEPILCFTTWQTLVFLLNSRYPLFCDIYKTFLFPKLRKQFAEFLQKHSFKCLSIFYQSTSVGFSTVLYPQPFLGKIHLTIFQYY